MNLSNDIEKILWTEEQILERVFKSRAITPLVVGVATGAFMFLVRKIQLPMTVDHPCRVLRVGHSLERQTEDILRLESRCSRKVEDIVDTGNTLSCLIDYMKSKDASSVSVCTLFDKPSRRKVHFELVGEGKYYCSSECPDYFVVGYGLDFDEQYRNLPYVGVLKPEVYES